MAYSTHRKQGDVVIHVPVRSTANYSKKLIREQINREIATIVELLCHDHECHPLSIDFYVKRLAKYEETLGEFVGRKP